MQLTIFRKCLSVFLQKCRDIWELIWGLGQQNFKLKEASDLNVRPVDVKRRKSEYVDNHNMVITTHVMSD